MSEDLSEEEQCLLVDSDMEDLADSDMELLEESDVEYWDTA